MKPPKNITKVISKARHPGGLRYDKSAWPPIVRQMLDQGKAYGEIGKALGVGTSTVCRYCWATGLTTHHEHRNTTRHQILKANGQAQAKA